MIDVIFLLLIFFVVTADFSLDEGAILATLPGGGPIDKTHTPELTTVLVEVTSADDGVTYQLLANGQRVDNVSDLHRYFEHRLGRDMKPDDRVEIKPQGVVRWQHVVNVYNACVRADLQEVGFSPS